MGGQARAGGKAKPLKAPKKDKKEDLTQEEIDFQLKESANKKKEQALKDQLLGKKGPLNTGSQGIKKSGKK